MIIYEVTKEFDETAGLYKKAELPNEAYRHMSLDEFSQSYPQITTDRPIDPSQKPKPFSWIHSWFIDELQEGIVKLATEGNLEGIKETIGEAGESPEYLSTIRFCNDGFATKKYEKSEGGAFSGYSLLNIAMFRGDRDMAKYLVEECDMNPNEKCYANPIWTAAFPSMQSAMSGAGIDQEREKFQILKEFSDSGMGIDFAEYRSGNANDTVFHLASRLGDHALREEALNFFKEKVPHIASVKNTFGAGFTPIKTLSNLFTSAENKAENKHLFHRDLEILKSCGGFDDYKTSEEYRLCPPNLKPILDDVFSQSVAKASSEESMKNLRRPSASPETLEDGDGKSGDKKKSVKVSSCDSRG